MAEVTGIDSTDPEGVGDGSLEPLKGVSGLYAILEKSLAIQSTILDVLRPISERFNTSDVGDDSTSANVDALQANTMALDKLSSTINTATLDVSLNGTQSKFFYQLLKAVGNKKKLVGIEKFGDIFEAMVEKLNAVSKYADNIETLASSLLGLFGTFKEFGKGMLMFAGGLALLGFTLVTFMEAITLGDILTFGAIMLVIAGASRLIDGSGWDFTKVAIGIATLGLAVWGFTEIIDAKMAVDFLVSITAVGAGIAILNAFAKGTGKNALSIAKAAGSIILIAGSVWVLNKAVSDFDDVDLVKTGEMILVTAGLATVWTLMGKFAISIAKGALASAAIGGSLYILAKGIDDMSQIDLTLGRGLELAAIIVAAAGIITLIGNPITIGFTLAGAAGAAAIGAALFVLAEGIKAIGTVNVTSEQASQFGMSLGYTVDAMLQLGNPFTLAGLALALPAGLALSAGVLATSAAMYAVSKLPIINQSSWENLELGVTKMSSIYSSFGLIEMARMTAGAAVMTVISLASVATAAGIWAFSKLSADPASVQNATSSLDIFISGVATTFEKNKNKLGAIRDNVDAFFGLGQMVGEIADSVQKISNLEFLEKSVVNGKVVTTGVRKFTPDDFAKVGASIGTIINSLTEPLAMIGSKKDSFSIGGIAITNPFSNKVEKGIEALQGIGSVFSPLADLINVWSKNGVDKQFVNAFSTNIATLLGGLGKAMSGENLDLNKEQAEVLRHSTMSVKSLLADVTNEKFEAGSKSFNRFSKDVVTVKDSLNAIDLSKMSKFNDVLYNLNEMGKNSAIDELVAVFSEFIERLADLESLRASGGQNSQMTQPVQVVNNNTATETKIETIKAAFPNMEESLQFANEDVVNAINQMYEFLVSGNLKIQRDSFNV